MPATREEVQQLASQFENETGDMEVAMLACLYHVSFGHRSDDEMAVIKPLVDLAHRCIEAKLDHDPVRIGAVYHAVRLLQRAQSTHDYLHHLPD